MPFNHSDDASTEMYTTFVQQQQDAATAKPLTHDRKMHKYLKRSPSEVRHGNIKGKRGEV